MTDVATPPKKRLKKKVAAPVAAKRTGTPKHKLKVMQAGIESLKPYRTNPRIGNVDAIADSLKTNGQFKPIVVLRRTREILVGNHTWKAAKKLGWSYIDVVYVNVTDEEAAKIVLADNRTSDLGSYDMDVLNKVLEGVTSAVGTGYSQTDIDMLHQAVSTTVPDDDLIRSLVHPDIAEQEDRLGDLTHVFDKQGAPHHVDDPHIDDDIDEPDLIDDQSEELPGVMVLKDDMEWQGKTATFWNIPVVSEQNLVTPDMLPDNIRTYIPRLHRAWPDDEQGWFIISRSGNSAGLAQPGKAIQAFYTEDVYFEIWWEQMSTMTTKMLNAGIRMAVSPNFSMYNDRPLAEHMWSLYKSRFITRYWQEVGIHVIPDFIWNPNDQFVQKYILPTWPKHIPVVAMQRHQGSDFWMKEENKKVWLEDLKKSYDATTPEVLLLYSGDPGYEMVMSANLPWEVRQIDTFANQMHGYNEAQVERQKIEARLARASTSP